MTRSEIIKTLRIARPKKVLDMAIEPEAAARYAQWVKVVMVFGAQRYACPKKRLRFFIACTSPEVKL